MKQKILFHVGLHKTATTTLQNDLFIPKHGFIQHPKGRNFFLPIFVNKFSTEPLNSLNHKMIDNFIAFANKSNLLPVISHERLSGYPISGGYDRLSIYRRIASLKNNVKILFVMREQNDWLYSAWRQMISDGRSISLRKFLQKVPSAPNARIPEPRLEYLNYYLEAMNLYSLFGKDNVLIIPYEILNNNTPEFFNRVFRFLDMEYDADLHIHLSSHNERKKLSNFYLDWAVNRFLVSSVTAPRAFFSPSRTTRKIRTMIARSAARIPEIPYANKIVQKHKKLISEEVGDYYARSNILASKELGINLEALGYNV